MHAMRPSLKRCGTSTNATSQTPARRRRLDDVPSSATVRDVTNSELKDTPDQPGIHPNTTLEMSLPIRTPSAGKFTTPPTPCSSPEPLVSETTSDMSDSSHNKHYRPGHCSTYGRNEFPFPIQPVPRQIRNKRLELSIPEEPAACDIQFPIRKAENLPVHRLPTPPRSHPSIPTSTPHFPQSATRDLPTPISASPSSGLPSLSSSQPYSPLSPKTPCTPRSRFNSAATTLKLVLMADELGMTTKELEELNEFATTIPMSGSSKRAGRVLVRKDVQQRKEKIGKGGYGYMDQSLYHRRRDCHLGNCSRHTGPDMWRDIDWSNFSDTSDDDMPDVGAEVNENVSDNYDSDEEMSALKGYMQMAIDADNGWTSVNGDAARMTELGTAKVLRRMRPAQLRIKTSVQRVEAAVGPMGERMWPCEI